MILELLNPIDFHEKVEEADGLAVVDFMASWCGHSKKIAPYFDELSDQVESIDFYKVDVDANRESSAKYKIKGMPTFVLFKDGEELERTYGSSKDNLANLISKYK